MQRVEGMRLCVRHCLGLCDLQHVWVIHYMVFTANFRSWPHRRCHTEHNGQRTEAGSWSVGSWAISVDVLRCAMP
jgi:hypothetical protein